MARPDQVCGAVSRRIEPLAGLTLRNAEPIVGSPRQRNRRELLRRGIALGKLQEHAARRVAVAEGAVAMHEPGEYLAAHPGAVLASDRGGELVRRRPVVARGKQPLRFRVRRGLGRFEPHDLLGRYRNFAPNRRLQPQSARRVVDHRPVSRYDRPGGGPDRNDVLGRERRRA
ncbi:MAG: hypothetical protein DCC68_17905 [Planctomycetota bacterium]|nr:MAG: hypothetical protein DCC68_17905 [Planctomycetota bacterium]